MNGALVIPKLMCIKFYRAEVERTALRSAKEVSAGLKINKKKPRQHKAVGASQTKI